MSTRPAIGATQRMAQAARDLPWAELAPGAIITLWDGGTPVAFLEVLQLGRTATPGHFRPTHLNALDLEEYKAEDERQVCIDLAGLVDLYPDPEDHQVPPAARWRVERPGVNLALGAPAMPVRPEDLPDPLAPAANQRTPRSAS